MGATCNPTPRQMAIPTKDSLQLYCSKLKHHLNIKKPRINQQIISGEKELVRLVTMDMKKRSKINEQLLAQKIVNGLKYTAVYTTLIQYADSIKLSAGFICQHLRKQQQVQLQPWLNKICSILYSADIIALSSLIDFKNCLQILNDYEKIEKYTDQQIKRYLTPRPTEQQLNMYMVQMSQRNEISLQKVNEIGNNFIKSKNHRQSLVNNNQRVSVVNPFDNNNMILEDINIKQQYNDKKIDQADDSISDLMKKIDNSRYSYKK